MNFISRLCLRIFQEEFTNQCHVKGFGRTFCFKSAMSLEVFYPKSSLKLFTPAFEPEDPSAKFNGFIPIKKLDIKYSASSGPGGQNVNCVNTKVDLRFNVKKATWLSEEIREKLEQQQKTRINKDGYLIIKSDVTRSQQLNLADALERLRSMIRQSAKVPEAPSPETEETIRKQQLKAAKERIFVKRKRSEVKKNRHSDNLNI